MFTLQTKLATYFGISPGDIFNEFIKIERNGVSFLTFDYKFSTRYLIGPNCNFSSIINLQKKLDAGTAEKALQEALFPQFSLLSIEEETFQHNCKNISSNPPIVNSSFGTKTIVTGQFFSFPIPTSLFVIPKYTEMRLKLELRFENDTVVAPDYWIGLNGEYADAGVLMRGVATSIVASSQSLYSFRLVAITPLLVEAYQNIQINLVKSSVQVYVSVLFTQTSMVTIPYVEFAQNFVTFMSLYLTVSQHQISVIQYSFASQSTIKWTLSTLSSRPCNFTELKRIQAKLIGRDGEAASDLKTGIANALNFSLSSVNINLSGSCDPPRVNVTIPILYVPRYDMLLYRVPEHAFQGGGKDLKMILLDKSGNSLQSDSWIWFDNYTITGFPSTLTKRQTFYYTLRAVSSDGASADQNVTIHLNWTAPAYNLAYQIAFNSDSSLFPTANIITTFIERLKAYFGQSSLSNIIIFGTAFLARGKVILHYQNVSLPTDSCDINGNNMIIKRLQSSIHDATPNQAFVSAMQPNITITNVQVLTYGNCLVLNRKPPYFNFIDPVALNFAKSIKMVPYCNVLSYLIPETLFVDEEEGNTRNLRLNLTADNKQSLPLSSWVNINTTSQMIIAVADDETFAALTGSYIQYRIYAFDSDGKFDYAPVRFNVSSPAQWGNYNVTMKLKVSEIGNQPYVLQLANLYETMNKVFSNYIKIHTRSYQVDGASGQATFVWSPCNMHSDLCNFTVIKFIRSKLFEPGIQDMQKNLNDNFQGTFFKVLSISESVGNMCKEEPPFIHQALPTLHIGFCGTLTYKIPDNTFKDKQDGNTSKLKLKLLQSNGSSIPYGNWLQFDSTSQTVIGVLNEFQYKESLPNEQTFIVVAFDSSNLSANTTLTVKLNGSMHSYSHTFTIQAVYSGSSALYTLSNKLHAYFGDSINQVQITSGAEALENKIIITWSNCSLRYDPCDVIGIKQIRSKMQTITGTLKFEFSQAMQPEFSQILLSEKNIGPCLTDEAPKSSAIHSPIYVSSCKTYKEKIPEGTFTDREQGSARNLDLSLEGNPYGWISLNSQSQELTILATNKIIEVLSSGSVKITLVAKDFNLQQASQEITIFLVKQNQVATHTITMQYQIAKLSSFTEMYDVMRENITQYYSNATDLLSTVEFEKLPSVLSTNTVLTAEWISCSLPRRPCDKTKINRLLSMMQTNSMLNIAFKTALKPYFDVLSAYIQLNGLCKAEMAAPIIQNPLPVINVSYCGYTEYQIPRNTFYDSIEGDTRNLSLSFLNSTLQPVIEPWIEFDVKSQQLRIVIANNLLSVLEAHKPITFKLKATTKRGASITENVRILVSDQPRNESINIKLNFAWIMPMPPPRNKILITIAERFATYIGSTITDIHFVSIEQEPLSSYPYFIVKIANCSIRYFPCDKEYVKWMISKLNDEQGMLPAFKTAMGSEIYVTYLQITEVGPCITANLPPYVLNPLGTIQVQTCSDFNYTLPSSTFRDEADSILGLSVTRVNGIPISGSYRWLRIISSNHLLIGVVTEKVIREQPPSGYNVTIRATDSGGLFVETNLIIQIVGEQPQKLYQFSLQLTSSSIGEQFFEEREIIRILNLFFKSSFTNIISYMVSQSSVVTIKSSICMLQNKCDEAAATSYFKFIGTDQNKPTDELQSFFAYKYKILSAQLHRNPLCLLPQNAPVVLTSKWIISGSYCGGVHAVVPDNMFYDKEDGNTRNLSLSLYLKDKQSIPNSYWIQINKTSQVIYGRPTRAETLKYSTETMIFLVATDKTGLESNTSIEFRFSSHPEPRYIYKIAYQTRTAYSNLVSELHEFSSQLQSYLNDASLTSVGLLQHSAPVAGLHVFQYANCSVSYNPCDTASLNSVKTLLLASSNLPTIAFKEAMKGFSISYGEVQVMSPCGDGSLNPPSVINRITQLNVSLCGLFSYLIPGNTFYDTENGNTRKLTLKLTDGQNRPLSSNSWIQLNGTSQTIYGYSTAKLAFDQRFFSFILTATDGTSLSASNMFTARITGPAQIIRDCQIQILFTTTAFASLSNIDLMQKIFNGLQRYFSLSLSEIGIADFTRQSNSQFIFSWSYCSKSYESYTSKVTVLRYSEYKQFIIKVLIPLFEPDHKTAKSDFYSAFIGLSVISVNTAFSGVCANIPPILVSLTELSLSVGNCGYHNERIQSDWFYDFEDGNTYNLNLQIIDFSNQTLDIGSWINIDKMKWYLKMSLRDKQRQLPTSRFTYYLKAIDSGQKSIIMPIHITKLSPTTTKSPFRITFQYKLRKTVTADLYVNESIILSDITSQLYSLRTGIDIITNDYVGQMAPEETRVFTWSPCTFEACSSSTTLQKTMQLLQSNRQPFDSFRAAYLPEFDLQRVYYISSCGVPGLPPATPDGPVFINVTMCSRFQHKLQSSTFVDSVDGELQNMRLRLLDSDKAPVLASSWIQLNAATLELYGVFQSSMLSSLRTSSVTSVLDAERSASHVSKVVDFYLEATNSRGLTSLNNVKVNVIDYPYTSDCRTTISVRRKFGGESTLETDVLYKLITAISQHYNDKTVRVKVYRFIKSTEFSYTLTFSNCSFVFASAQAAKWGLDESHRSSVREIFSKMVEMNGTAKASFLRSLSLHGFILESISNSYSCIEEPPSSIVKSLRLYAFLCREFYDPLSTDLFYDRHDGTNLNLQLSYTNGLPVSPNEWVQLDTRRKAIYGSVTYQVKQNIPSFEGYKYLLVATDSSGRSANVTYLIKIANALPIQDVQFTLRFESVFTEFSRTTDLQLNVTRKLAKYLNDNDEGRDVVIRHYHATNLITFELCSFQCTPAMMASTIPKLQKQLFKTEPSDAFKAAMGPDIIPTYILVNGPKCIESTSVTIFVNYVITTNQPICGFINFTIPADVLSNSLGERTRDFLLTMKTASGHLLKHDSFISFLQGLQAIHGVAVYSKLSSKITYTLTASSSRSNVGEISTNVQINFPDYNTFRETENRLCTFKVTVTTTINPALTDAYIIKRFIQDIAMYFNGDFQQVLIVSYTRSVTYPIELTIVFSNCSWLYILQSTTTIETYYQQIESMSKSIFQYNGATIIGLSSRFVKALQPDFTVVNVVTNTTTCKPPADRPPKARYLEPIIVASCGEFNYQIPEDLFSDEDGNTKNLKVDILQSDGQDLSFDSWIIFNQTTQIISGLPLNVTLAQQPVGGYDYRIKATDKLKQTTFAKLIIKIDGKPFEKYNDVGLSIIYASSINSKFQMAHILAFTRRVSAYIGDPLNKFRVIEYTLLPNRISMTLMNCTRCNAIAVLKYNTVYITRNIFNLYMAPEFPISFYLRAEGKCIPSERVYYNVTSGNTFNVSFCRRSSLDFLKLNGITQLPPYIKFIVKSETQTSLPIDSWFWFNETSSVLETFPSELTWKNQPINGTYFLTALVSNGQRLSSYKKDAVLIIDTPPSSGLQYTAKFKTTLPGSTIDAYLISLVFSSLYSYFGREDLQVVSFKREQGNTLSFELTYLICGLPTDCTNSSVKALNNIIFITPSNLKPEFTEIFPHNLQILSISDNCKDTPPVVLKPVLNITIPICGFFRYKIPKTFAVDVEDGDADNLSLSMRMNDNSLLSRDSWIQFNETSHEIYALPTESFIRSQPSTGWPFLIIVKDKGGRQVQSSLNVFLLGDDTSFYQLSVSVQTVNTETSMPYLDIQVNFLTMLTNFYSDPPISQYGILSFTKIGTAGNKAEVFHIKLKDCSVKQAICMKENEQLMSMQADMQRSHMAKDSQFYKYMSILFIITSVKYESSYKIDKPPIVWNKMSEIQLDACGMFVDDIPPGTFYDEEQGAGLNMILTHNNGTHIEPTYWIQLINSKLYVVPDGNVESGTYSIMLSASDHCNQTVNTSVTIRFEDRRSKESYYFLQLQASVRTTMPRLYYISQVKSALKDFFSDATYKTKITYYMQKNTALQLRWKNCSIICNHTDISRIRNKLFLAFNIMNPTFLSLLNFNVTNITEIYSGNCSKPISEPPIANRSLLLKVSICSQLNFTVPFDLFYDKEDGNTRNLHLSFLTESKKEVDKTNWVQLDQKEQILQGYPRIDKDKQTQRIFEYFLAATDKTGYSAITPLKIEVTGQIPTISYILTMNGRTTISKNTPWAFQEIMLIQRIGNYFDDHAINDVSYIRNEESFQFTWSFCSMKTDKCDCFKIARIKQMSLFVKKSQQFLGSEFELTNQITDQMIGVCTRTQKPELQYDLNEVKIASGQYFSYTIRDDMFYDYEDGYTRNLSLYLSDGNNNKLPNSHWIKLQDYKICGLLTLVEADKLQATTTTSNEYKATAKDNCGEERRDSFLVRTTSLVTILHYKITVIIRGDFASNCSQIQSFITKMSSYMNTPTIYVFIHNYTTSRVYENATAIVWGLRNITENNCNNYTVKMVQERFIYENGTVTGRFYNHMKPHFEVIHVLDEKSEGCHNATVVPSLPKEELEFPWWIIIIILILIIIILLCWLFWLCIPRCCAAWCLNCCHSCCATWCGKCCMPGGKYASLDEEAVASMNASKI